MNHSTITRIEKLIIFVLISGIVFLVICSCKVKQPVISERVDSVTIERLIPVSLPADSATIKALLECNANGRVVLSQLRTESTRNAYLNFLLNSLGNLEMETIVRHDTIYVRSDSIRISEIVTQYKYIEKQHGKWDSFILRFGNWMFGGLCCVALFILSTSVIKKIKK